MNNAISEAAEVKNSDSIISNLYLDNIEGKINKFITKHVV